MMSCIINMIRLLTPYLFLHMVPSVFTIREIIEDRKKALEGIGWTDMNSIYPPYIGLFYSIVSGIVGAQCVLQLKEICAFFKVRSQTSRRIVLRNKKIGIQHNSISHICWAF